MGRDMHRRTRRSTSNPRRQPMTITMRLLFARLMVGENDISKE
jgi:hypothetical protein